MDNNDRIVKIVMDFFFLTLIVLFVIWIFPKLFIYFFPLFIGYFIACRTYLDSHDSLCLLLIMIMCSEKKKLKL